MPNFPSIAGTKGKLWPSLDLGRTGIWIYKVPDHLESIKLILEMMPTSMINCQMIIKAGKAFRHPFLESLFSCRLGELIS